MIFEVIAGLENKNQEASYGGDFFSSLGSSNRV